MRKNYTTNVDKKIQHRNEKMSQKEKYNGSSIRKTHRHSAKI
jgi:hypothetical protein